MSKKTKIYYIFKNKKKKFINLFKKLKILKK